MSRCFPYPSPAYAGKCASNEALICTIKLQRDSDKTKSEKKERRKEKKEKKRYDKSNGTVSKEKNTIRTDEKLYTAGKSGHPEACSKTKLQEYTYDNMEKSSLTEEHGKPCCSSDSTENSGKRKRQSSPHPNLTKNSGTVIRIVLNQQKKEDRPTPSSSNNTSLSMPAVKLNSLPKKSDVEVKTASNLRIAAPKSNAAHQFKIISSNKKADLEAKHLASKSNATQQPNIVNSNLGKLAPLSRKADVEAKHLTSNIHITPPKSNAVQQLNISNSNQVKLAPLPKKADVEAKHLTSNLHITPLKSNAVQQLNVSNSNKEKVPFPEKKIHQGSTSKAEKKLPRPLRKYQALFENWVPVPMEVDTVDDEEDWLSGGSSKKEECQSAKRTKYSSEEVVPNCGNALIQPWAQYLSDVDIYALPFTVPF